MDGGLEGSITSYALMVQASDGTNTETVTVEITVTPPITVPAVEILAQTSSMEAGQSARMRVRAFDLDAAESYAIRVTTDGASLGFDTGCTDQEEPVTVLEGATPLEVAFTLHGCTVPGTTVTTNLLEGTKTVGAASLVVTVVVASTEPSIQIWGLAPVLVQGQSDQFMAMASYLAPLTSFFVTLGTDNANLGFSDNCLIRGQEDLVNSGDPSHTMSRTLHGCAVPGGTMTAELIRGSSTVVDTATWDVQVVASPKDAPPGPTGVDASLASGVFTISWDAVTGVTNFLVEHRSGGDQGTWTSMATGTNTTMDYTPSGGVTCETTYDFRVRAYGDGAFYTEDCNMAPEFEAATYTFTVSEDAEVGDDVGTVSATDEDTDDTLTYSITLGNFDGKFEIEEESGQITVAEALDHETEDQYTLTVQASDGNGSTVTVTIAVVDATCSGALRGPTPTTIRVWWETARPCWVCGTL